MLTLAQAKQLSQDKLTQEVIDEFRQSGFMDALPFDDNAKAQGESMTYVYNRITTQPTAQSRAINGEYTAQETVTTQQVATLGIFGGSYQVDRVLIKHEKQVVDHIDFQSKQKAKAGRAKFLDLLINGNKAVDAKEFDGLNKIVTGSTTDITITPLIDLSTQALIKANAENLLYGLRQLIKNMDGVTHLLMNRDAFAVFQSVSDVIPNVSYTRDTLGNVTYFYGSARIEDLGDKPGTTTPIIATDVDGKTDIYAVRVGLDGVHGVSPEGADLISLYYPDMKAPGAVKTGEVEAVAAVVAKTTKSVGVLRGIKVVTPQG